MGGWDPVTGAPVPPPKVCVRSQEPELGIEPGYLEVGHRPLNQLPAPYFSLSFLTAVNLQQTYVLQMTTKTRGEDSFLLINAQGCGRVCKRECFVCCWCCGSNEQTGT